MTVAASKEIQHGSGKDSWMLEIEDVVTYAKVGTPAIPLRSNDLTQAVVLHRHTPVYRSDIQY